MKHTQIRRSKKIFLVLFVLPFLIEMVGMLPTSTALIGVRSVYAKENGRVITLTPPKPPPEKETLIGSSEEDRLNRPPGKEIPKPMPTHAIPELNGKKADRSAKSREGQFLVFGELPSTRRTAFIHGGTRRAAFLSAEGCRGAERASLRLSVAADIAGLRRGGGCRFLLPRRGRRWCGPV